MIKDVKKRGGAYCKGVETKPGKRRGDSIGEEENGERAEEFPKVGPSNDDLAPGRIV